MKNEHDNTAMRLDKWLWAARFFKTRALAQKHIELGRVQVNGAKVKNSKNISAGDIIDLTLNSLPYKIKVMSFRVICLFCALTFSEIASKNSQK